MGRAPLGAAAKQSIGSVRLNESEKKILVAKYGTVGKALRHLVNEELRKELEK